jgi:hypothetical protein
LYLFANDKPNVSTLSAAGRALWPRSPLPPSRRQPAERWWATSAWSRVRPAPAR